jgi:alpha-tubulin suppressor-like RCC1 family protein
VHCWGDASLDQLGIDQGDHSYIALRADYGQRSEQSEVLAVGSHHTLVAIGDQLFCFGSNANMQCGRGWPSRIAEPEQVEGIAVSEVASAGAGHSCALTGDRAVRCWGQNDRGQLGRGDSGQATATIESVVGLEGDGN